MEARRLGSDHEDKEATLARRQILIVIEDLGCRLNRGQPVQQFLFGFFVGAHVLGLLAPPFVANDEQADRWLCRDCLDQVNVTHTEHRARRTIKPPNA
jgi:hypothetical protein